MKKTFTFCFIAFSLSSLLAQQQIGNSNMEAWDNIGAATEEPTNWNGIKTASGNAFFISFAPQAVSRSTDTPSGSGYSARLETQSALGIPANGTMTCGRINVGSATVADPSNYSWSETGDSLFSETLTDMPDSIVWWAKFEAADPAHLARMKATLHDDYDYRDPEDATSLTHIVGNAIENYGSTGQWERHAVAIDYSGPATDHTHILVTFTTNQTPGVGTIGDYVLIDDVQLIYNSTIGVDELNTTFFTYYSTENGLTISGNETLYEVFNLSGQQLKFGSATELNGLKLNSGIYIVKSSSRSEKVLVP